MDRSSARNHGSCSTALRLSAPVVPLTGAPPILRIVSTLTKTTAGTRVKPATSGRRRTRSVLGQISEGRGPIPDSELPPSRPEPSRSFSGESYSTCSKRGSPPPGLGSSDSASHLSSSSQTLKNRRTLLADRGLENEHPPAGAAFIEFYSWIQSMVCHWLIEEDWRGAQRALVGLAQ